MENATYDSGEYVDVLFDHHSTSGVSHRDENPYVLEDEEIVGDVKSSRSSHLVLVTSLSHALTAAPTVPRTIAPLTRRQYILQKTTFAIATIVPGHHDPTNTTSHSVT